MNADGLPFDHLIFTADLLGNGRQRTPRALERVVDQSIADMPKPS